MALDLTGAKLTFADEFNQFSWNPDGSSSITKDTTNNGTWTTHYYWGAGDRTLWGNSEQQYYADASTSVVQKYPNLNPFSVSNGVLTITAQPSPDTSLTQGLPYVSGMITTDGTFSQTYGYFEMRAEMPTGGGSWPAFWLLNAAHGWPPEIDVVEMVGKEPGHVYTTGHTGIGGHSTDGMHDMTDVGDIAHTGMHSYGVMVMPDVTTWYFDGQEIFRCATAEDWKQPMYMIANLAEGGSWPGAVDGQVDQMKIDYIRAYQMPGTPGYDSAVPVGTTPSQPPTASPGAPVTATIGSGSDSLVLKLTQDFYLTGAQYTVSVDGKQVGDTQTAGAVHGSGQADVLTVKGDWAAGSHTVTVNFLNDGYGGSATLDRNLYVESATYNGASVAGAARTLWSNGPSSFGVTDLGTSVTSAPVTATIGSGSDSLVLKVSQDWYQAGAQYTVSVDGKQVGGTLTAGAIHGSGQTDTITVKGDWAVGSHQVQVNFLNDAYGGSASADRNLYVEGATYNGTGVSGAAKTFWSAGPQSFGVNDTTAVGVNDTTPVGGAATVIGTGADRIVLKISEDAWNGDAQFTVSVDGVQQGGTLTARALRSAGASDVFTIQGDWGVGSHQVQVTFLNDAYGGSASADRNLHVDGITWNGTSVGGTPATLWSAGTKGFSATDSTAAPSTTHTPISATIGTGADKLYLRISEDAYNGDAQYRILVDGKQVDGLLTASALHGSGSDVITVQGDWAAGSHKLTVEFVNDLYGGSASADRNLYVDGISFDDAAVAGGAVAVAGGTAALYSAGARDFWFA